jgi:hypothetical protein
MSKDQILGFAMIASVGMYVYGRAVAAKMRARFDRARLIELAKYRHPGSK